MKGVRIDIFGGNLRSVLGKLVSSTFFEKKKEKEKEKKEKKDFLRIIPCSYQAFRYSIVYINENCQAAIIFNNLCI